MKSDTLPVTTTAIVIEAADALGAVAVAVGVIDGRSKRQKDEGEKDSEARSYPNPLYPLPLHSHCFLSVIFVNTPLNPYLATGFKTRK